MWLSYCGPYFVYLKPIELVVNMQDFARFVGKKSRFCMDNQQNQFICNVLERVFGAQTFEKIEVVQSLWSGYGEIARYRIDSENRTVIVKSVVPPSAVNHPRGWHSNISHQRKISSYHNEQAFYRDVANRLDKQCRVPQCIEAVQEGESFGLILEDLDAAGYAQRTLSPQISKIARGLHWLARFHANTINLESSPLWPVGTYWHLGTRPDEYKTMPEGALKRFASDIDSALSSARYQCLVHGDAKVANLCFSDDFQRVSAVDFQYVGGGVGVKDVAYFLGSCLDDNGLQQHATRLLETYFDYLRNALTMQQEASATTALIKEWRGLYPLAWADFERFLLGWAPQHKKLTPYSNHMATLALQSLS